MILPLILLTLVSASGLLLYTKKSLSPTLLKALLSLGAGAMLAVSLVHILPEALEETPHAIYAFLGGFLVIYLIEEFLTPHEHDHKHGDHLHEDPHEHHNHVALVAWMAICIHTLFDGFGIRAGMGLSEEVGYMVLFGVMIHQLPVSLSLAAIFRESHIAKNIQILLMVIFAVTAALGYVVSDIFLEHTSHEIAGLAAAFAGGSLLYVATVDLIPIVHNQGKKKILSLLFFLLGTLGVMGIRLFEGDMHVHGEHAGDAIHEVVHED